MKMAKNHYLVIINKEKEVCKGLQTTVHCQEKSILDYYALTRIITKCGYKKLQKKIDTEADKQNIKERHNSSQV